MLILLPPSEGKTSPSGRRPLDPDSLAFADELGPKRRELLEALATVCAGPVDDAVAALGITPGQAGEVERNAEIPTAPTGPASSVYTGVLYDRLGFNELSPMAKRRAARSLLIASGLWGVTRPGDRIPYYRFSMKPKLAGIGGLAAFWRPALTAAMEGAGHDREGGLVLDLRSGSYSSVWKPKRARHLAVRGFTETNGKRKVISHMAKAIRGDVARVVLEAARMPGSAEAVAAAVEAAGMQVELGPGQLDVIVSG